MRYENGRMISYQSEHGTQMKNEVQNIVKAMFKLEKSKHIIISFHLCGQSENGTRHTHTDARMNAKT